MSVAYDCYGNQLAVGDTVTILRGDYHGGTATVLAILGDTLQVRITLRGYERPIFIDSAKVVKETK